MRATVFEGVQFGDWPTRTALPPSDRFAVARDRLMGGIRMEIDVLDGGDRGRGWPWYRVVNGVWHCGLRVAGRIMVLNDAGKTTYNVMSAEEAKELYKEILAGVQAGEFDEMIRQHLASIPRRVRRN